MRDTQFIPTPLQLPRIPIWVGGNWPHRAPFRRAARWDGMMPQVDLNRSDELVQLRQAIQYTLEQRKSDTAYEVVYSTSLVPGSDLARLAERIGQYAEAGITWLLEQIYPHHFGGDWQGNWPVEAMRQRIRQGPPTE